MCGAHYKLFLAYLHLQSFHFDIGFCLVERSEMDRLGALKYLTPVQLLQARQCTYFRLMFVFVLSTCLNKFAIIVG
jgi:hypothetical protein